MAFLTRIFGGPTAVALPDVSSKKPHTFNVLSKINIDQFTREGLLFFRKVIDLSEMKDHPLSKKVDAALQNTPLAKKPTIPFYEESPEDSDPTFQKQGFLKIDEMKKRIINEGSTFTKLSLNCVDDELLELVGANCPNLTSLVIRIRQDRPPMHLTDKGITALAKLTNLTEFTFFGWEAMYVSEQSFLYVFSTPAFQSKVTKLHFFSPIFGPDLVPVLNGLKVIEDLGFHTGGIPSTAMQSLQLPPTITTLGIGQATSINVGIIDDIVLKKIATFTSLKSLSVQSLMKGVTEGAIISLLKALPNLEHFSWNGSSMNDNIVSHLPSGLVSLSMSDCTQVSNQAFATLIPRLTVLKSLLVMKGSGFVSAPGTDLTDIMALLPRDMVSLYVDSTWISSFKTIPPQLKSLTLQNIRWTAPNAFADLKDLPLETLRIIKCNTFGSEALQHVLSGTMKKTLVSLGLVKLPISPASIKSIESLEKLKILLISQCGGLEVDGARALLSSPTLRGQLTHLLLNEQVVKPEYYELLDQWRSLMILFIGNALELPYKDQDKIWDVRNIKLRNGVGVYWAGLSFGWNAFTHAM